jgi:wyosine [tRNA(Phe)-imidazoG37] synthetase (radical SAM superfamily)
MPERISPSDIPKTIQFALDLDMQRVIDSMHQQKRNKTPKKFSWGCGVPLRTILIDHKGKCFLCVCQDWAPYSVGTIEQFSSLEDIWESPKAKEIQKETAPGASFKYCNTDRCGISDESTFRDEMYLLNNLAKGTYYKSHPNKNIIYAIDESCNLACPSCRVNKIFLKSGPEFNKKKLRNKAFMKMLKKFHEPVHVDMAGTGDSFSSLIYREFLYNYEPNDGQTFTLKTNGLLFNKQFLKLPILAHVTSLMISIDAGSKEVYEIVRPPGKWEDLIKNLDMIAESNIINYWKLSFVCQKNNYKDMINFNKLCKRYNVSGHISHLGDWNTWPNFKEHEIQDPNHPEHEELKKCIHDLKQSKFHKVRLDHVLSQL